MAAVIRHFAAISAGLLAAACTSGGGPAAETERPLVVLLAPIAGPTAAADRQWLHDTRTVSKPIPDNASAGVSDPNLRIAPAGAAGCSALYEVQAQVSILHPRVADLVITLSSIATGGAATTATLWDGPAEAAKDPANAASLVLPSAFGAWAVMGGTDCHTFQLAVVDRVAGQTGTLLSWTLDRRTALFPVAHDLGYYERLVFGGETLNVRDYFIEVSRRKFSFRNAGAFERQGSRADWSGVETDEERVGNMTHLLEDAGFNFGAYDRNNDGRVDNAELELLTITNTGAEGGMNRDHAGGCTRLKRSTLQVCSHMAFAGQQPDFLTLTHELTHSLDAHDLYGRWGRDCLSQGLTLMSCTPGGPDAKYTMYLDPWYRAKFGWLFPYNAIYPHEMGDETWRDSRGGVSRPAKFPNGRNSNEYYLFEYRGRRGYDANASDFGIVAWHILEDGHGDATAGTYSWANGVNAVGPDSNFGSSRAWSEADGPFMLQWADKTWAQYSFHVTEPKNSASSAILDVEPVPADHRPPEIRIVAPSDNSSLDRGFVNFEAIATGGSGNLTVTWRSSADGYLGQGTRLTALLAVPGDRTIEATVRDRFGSPGKATVKITINYVKPTATIYEPLAGAQIFRNQPVRLFGKGTTPGVFSVPCDWLTWTIDRLPSWSLQSSGRDGQCDDSAAFDLVGPATIRLSVTDKEYDGGSPLGGLVVTTTVSVPVLFVDPTPTAPPIVTIVSPTSGRLMSDTNQPVSGVVIDPAGGPVTYRWTVFDVRAGQETDIGTTPAFMWRPDTVLRGGSIELRLYGSNSRGQTTVARRATFVEPPPR